MSHTANRTKARHAEMVYHHWSYFCNACRYDVKYGSGGFNAYGYQAGCTFVNGTTEEALEEPAAARFLCERDEVGTRQCFHDFSGQGICLSELFLGYDDFYAVDLVHSSTSQQS